LDKKDIATLIEALCDRPLAAGRPELSARSRHSAVAKVIGQSAKAPPNAVPDPESDVDRVTTVLASILSGMHVATTARGAFDEAALRSASVRLDARSALAFLERTERSPQTAPVHLVEQILAAAAPQQPTSSGEAEPGVFSAVLSGSWSMRRWRIAAAGIVLLVAGGLSWSVVWESARRGPVGAPPASAAKTSIESSSLNDAPAEPKPAPTAIQRCKTSDLSKDATVDRLDRGDRSNPPDTTALRSDCDGTTAAAASKVDAPPSPGTVHADHGGPMFGATNLKAPATTLSTPAASPNLGAASSTALPPIRPRNVAPAR
jgi:hypothetical protein